MPDDALNFNVTAKDHASGTVQRIKGLLNDTAAEAKKSLLTGVGLAGGVAAFNVLSSAVGGVVNIVGDSITAASDMNETVSKLRTVFGESAAGIERWGESSSTSMGISEQAALEAAGTFGNLFTAMKVNVPAAAEMSKGIVGLAADLASFNNSNPEEVLIALRAGLVGETEPLRRFGINLSAVTIAAKAVEMGLAKTTAQVSAGAKAQAAYALIFEQSTTAQGDFERTSDGLANTQRILAAEMANVQVELGQKLLPVMVELAHFAVDVLVPALSLVIHVISTVATAVDDAATLITGFMDMGANAVVEQAKKLQEAKDVAADAALALSGNADAAASHYMAMGESIQGASEQVSSASEAMAKSINTKWDQAHAAAVAKAIALPGDISQALIDGTAAVEAGVTALTTILEDEWTDATRIAYLKGVLGGEELARGLASTDADARGAALTLQETASAELHKLESGAYDAAVDAGTTVAEQLRIQASAAGAAAGHLAQVAMNHLKIDGTAGGRSGGASWINAMIAAVRNGRVTLQGEMNEIRALMGRSLPTKGPLTNPRRGGLSIGNAWVGGIVDAIHEGLPDLVSALPSSDPTGGGWRDSGSGLPPSAVMDLMLPVGTGMPSDNAILAPTNPRASGTGLGVTVVFQTAFPPTPAQALGIAQSIGPEMERWRRQQGLSN